MWSRSELKGNARQVLSRTYGKMLMISLLLIMLGSVSFGATLKPDTFKHIFGVSIFGNPGIKGGWGHFGTWGLTLLGMSAMYGTLMDMLLHIFLTAPLNVSVRRFLLINRSGGETGFKDLAYAFGNSYLNIVKVLFFQYLYIFLWGLLLCVPGIVKSYEYRMIPYLMTENPNLSKEEAFAISKKMMDGEKWEVFVMDCSFIGLLLLSVFTFGLLNLLYVLPYRLLTDAELYAALKEKAARAEA